MCWDWWRQRPPIVTASPGARRCWKCFEKIASNWPNMWPGWPGVVCAAPESTYLAWLDLRQSALSGQESPAKVLLERAGVALSDGADFGWPGFVRLNFGTTAAQLGEALARMDRVLAG